MRWPPAAVQFHEGGIRGVGGHHDPLAAFQDFRQHFLRAYADEPMPSLVMPMGTGSYLSGRGRESRMLPRPENLMLAERPPKRIPIRSLFLLSGSLFDLIRWVVELIQVISYK